MRVAVARAWLWLPLLLLLVGTTAAAPHAVSCGHAPCDLGDLEMGLALPACVGRYCGRLSEDVHAKCETCPRGSRTDGAVCRRCEGRVSAYQVLYLLGVWALVALVHLYLLHSTVKAAQYRKELSLIAMVEVVVAGVLALLTSTHDGDNLLLRVCAIDGVADWYPVLSVRGEQCGSEVVWPLFSMVLRFFGFCVLSMLCARMAWSEWHCEGAGATSIYKALLFFPTAALLHCVVGGLLYYSFPYILLVLATLTDWSMVAAAHDASLPTMWRRADRHDLALRYALLFFGVCAVGAKNHAPPWLYGVAVVLPVAPGVCAVLVRALWRALRTRGRHSDGGEPPSTPQRQ